MPSHGLTPIQPTYALYLLPNLGEPNHIWSRRLIKEGARKVRMAHRFHAKSVFWFSFGDEMRLSFFVEDSFVIETDHAAKMLGRSRSEHLRIAVENENRRAWEARMAFLSQQLADQHLVLREMTDERLGGLDANHMG